MNGGRVRMIPGDFIITPSWAWYGHTHKGDTPMIWLDGLDNGLMAQLDTTFFEPDRPDESGSAPSANSVEGAAREMLAGAGRILRYPYYKAWENLGILRDIADANPSYRYRMEYLNPADGGPAMPTMTTMLMLLDEGFSGRPYRSTHGTIFAVLEGEGETTIGGETFAWQRHDVFVVPPSVEYAYRSKADSVLFSFSDRVVQQKLGVWREAQST